MLLNTERYLRALPTGVTFNEELTETEKNHILGSPALLAELAEDAGEIVSVETISTNLNDSAVGNSEDETDITINAIDNFNLTVVVQRINDRPDDDNFKFIAVGKWLTNPVWELKDAIGIAWSDSFTLYDDDCYVVDAGGSKLRGYVDQIEMVPEVGLVYEIDLSIVFEEKEIVLVAYVYKDDSSGSANVAAKYGHETFGFSSISASVSPAPSISLSVGIGSGLYTESTYTSFDY